jgi:hypothetical protein
VAGEEDELDSHFGDTADSLVSDDIDGTAASTAARKPTEAEMMEVADLLRQVGDQVQARYGEEIERIIQNIDWLMPRATLLQEFHRLSSDFLCHISDGWVRVMVLCAFVFISSVPYLCWIEAVAIMHDPHYPICSSLKHCH